MSRFYGPGQLIAILHSGEKQVVYTTSRTDGGFQVAYKCGDGISRLTFSARTGTTLGAQHMNKTLVASTLALALAMTATGCSTTVGSAT
ncbi:MAG TPA: hypothetical protein VIT92_01810, partial [Burkholderiaceae bacterium]